MLVHSRFAVPRRYHRAIGLGAVVTLTAVIAACSEGDGGVLSPSSIARAAGADTSNPRGDTTHKPPRDTTKPPRDTTKPPRDTTKPPPRDTLDTLPPLPEKVAVSGRVLGVVVVAPTDSARDTLRFDPVAGAKIRIMRNILVNGRSAQELAAQLTTDANGRFSVSLKGGYYVVYADPPVGSNWSGSYSYLAATRPRVTVDVYLWKRGGG